MREKCLCALNLFYSLFVVKLGVFTFQVHDSIVRVTYDKQSWLTILEYESVTQSRNVTSLFRIAGENGAQTVLLVLTKVSFL